MNQEARPAPASGDDNRYFKLGGVQIRGCENLSLQELKKEIEAGARFVFYEYCISFLVVSQRRPSAIYFLRPGQKRIVRGLPYVLLSLLFGWWGLPWGLIYTPLTLLTNLSGGSDVTEQVMAALEKEAAHLVDSRGLE
jgi:hypothetical protein